MSGYYIPPKSSIVVDGYTLNRTARVWGDDPNVFRPERFAGLSSAEYRYSFWRFGLGPRCVTFRILDER
jgi:cytochrome P450